MEEEPLKPSCKCGPSPSPHIPQRYSKLEQRHIKCMRNTRTGSWYSWAVWGHTWGRAFYETSWGWSSEAEAQPTHSSAMAPLGTAFNSGRTKMNNKNTMCKSYSWATSPIRNCILSHCVHIVSNHSEEKPSMLDFVMISPQLLDPFRIQHLLLICITLKKNKNKCETIWSTRHSIWQTCSILAKSILLSVWITSPLKHVFTAVI